MTIKPSELPLQHCLYSKCNKVYTSKRKKKKIKDCHLSMPWRQKKSIEVDHLYSFSSSMTMTSSFSLKSTPPPWFMAFYLTFSLFLLSPSPTLSFSRILNLTSHFVLFCIPIPFKSSNFLSYSTTYYRSDPKNAVHCVN